MAVQIDPKAIANWNKAKHELISAAEHIGIDPELVVRMAGLESMNFSPKANPGSLSSAYGYGQFTKNTWHETLKAHGEDYGIPNASKLSFAEANHSEFRDNTHLQAAMLAEHTRDNMQYVKDNDFGNGPNGAVELADIYAIHNLGAGSGPKFLVGYQKNPNNLVSDELNDTEIHNNRGIYKDAAGNVVTFQQAYDKINEHMSRAEIYVKNMHSDIPLEIPQNVVPLKLGDEGKAVRDYQERLVKAGYQVDVTGVFDEKTFGVTQQLQSDCYLYRVNGVVGFETYAALNATISERPYQLSQIIPERYAEIAGLNEKYQTTTDINERKQLEADLQAQRLDISKLEFERSSLLGEQIDKVQDQKTELTNQFETNAAKITALGDIQQKLTQVDAKQSNVYGSIQADLDQAGISLLTSNQKKIVNKETLDLTNKADIKDLQHVLHDDDLLKANPNGNFGPQTQTALREALGKEADYAFDTSKPLEKSDINQLVKSPESFSKEDLSARLDAEQTTLQSDQAQITAKLSRLDQSLANIEAKRPMIVEQKIAEEQATISTLQSQIKNYDQERIAPLNQIQEKLQDYAKAVRAATEAKNPEKSVSENTQTAETASTAEKTVAGNADSVNLVQQAEASDDQKGDSQAGANESALDLPANPYAAVKDDLAAAHISVLSQREREFYEADSKKFDKENASDVEFVQKFLDQRGLLPKGETFGAWSEKTEEALKVYQGSHLGLHKDGDPGKNTRAAMKEDHFASLSFETIHKKIETAKHLALENKPHDVADMQSQIQTLQNNLKTLQNEHQQVVSHQVEHYKNQKTEIDAQLKNVDQSMAEIDRIQKKLDTFNAQPEQQYNQQPQPTSEPASTTPYAHIKPDLEKANISLTTPAETTLSKYEQIDVKNTDQVKALQTVLHEHDVFDKENINGRFGPKTQGALCKALDIEDKSTFQHTTTLNKETLNDLTDSRLNKLTSAELQQSLQRYEDQLSSQKQTLSSQQTSLHETLNQLEGKQQDSVSETVADNNLSSQSAAEASSPVANESASNSNTLDESRRLFNNLVAAIQSGDPKAKEKAYEDIENSDFGKAFRAEQEAAYQAHLQAQELERQRLEHEQKQKEQEELVKQRRGMELDF